MSNPEQQKALLKVIEVNRKVEVLQDRRAETRREIADMKAKLAQREIDAQEAVRAATEERTKAVQAAKALGVSFKDMGEKIGVSPSMMTYIAKGKR